MKLYPFCVFAALLFLPSVHAADSLKGAQTVIEEALQKKTAESDKSGENEDSPEADLRKALDDFKEQSGAADPERAAQEWVKLLDQYISFAREQNTPRSMMRRMSRGMNSEDALTFQAIFKVLPGPKSWATLARLVNERPAPADKDAVQHHALRLLVATLIGNVENQKAAFKDLDAASKANPQMRQMISQYISQLRGTLLELSDNAADRKQMIYDQLAYYEAATENDSWNVPDLVLVVGAAEAEALLRRMLVLPRTELFFREGNQTQALARKIALELIDKITNPPWGLVDTPDAVDLYEALNKKFPPIDEETASKLEASGVYSANRNDYQRQQAREFYVLGLIFQERFDDAEKVLESNKGEEEPLTLWYYSRTPSKKNLERLSKFLKGYLDKHPEAPFWNLYASAALAIGQAEAFLESVQAVLKSDSISNDIKGRIRRFHYPALLVADKVEEAIQEIRAVIAQPPAPLAPDQFYYGDEGSSSTIASLAKLGDVLERPALIGEAVQSYLQAKEAEQKQAGYQSTLDPGELVNVLIRRGDFATAESLLAAELKETGEDQEDFGYSFGRLEGKSEILSLLAQVYTAANRPKDVLALLEKAPWWGAKDLAELERNSYFPSHYDKDRIPIQYLAAKALASQGRKEEALRAVQALLQRDSGYDPAYELLLELEGESALPFLEKLYTQDRFEERPLIWKAVILKGQNKLDEAEKMLREAIAIDPSDGEQGPPHRMRVYGVLAEVRAGRGDQKEAEFFENVTKAIRLSEEADKVHAAGLISRALKLYEQSLTLFADAYCIQSRLALRYSELGMTQAAEEHYQRAYELMPDSFGRVESHCFGCEGVFNEPTGQNIAERVFTKLVVSQPAKPQVHYLLGYLREAQEKYPDAVASLQKAVELDPDYLNAWAKLQSLQEHVLLPIQTRDQIALNILRLDPLQRHGKASIEAVTDLAGLWVSAERAIALAPVPPKTLMELTASRKIIEEREEALKKAGGSRGYYNTTRYLDSQQPNTPAEYLLRQKVVEHVSQVINMPSI